MDRAWWRSPWLPFGVAVVPAALTLWTSSVPGGYWTMGLTAFTCWALVGSGWLVLAILAVRALPAPRVRNLARLWAFLALPLAFLATFATVRSGATAHAAFRVDRSSLEALATEARTSPPGHVRDRGFTLFTISDATREPGIDCVLLTVEGAGFFGATGYAHCPGRAPRSVSAGGDGYTFQHLDGPWYVFSLVW